MRISQNNVMTNSTKQLYGTFTIFICWPKFLTCLSEKSHSLIKSCPKLASISSKMVPVNITKFEHNTTKTCLACFSEIEANICNLLKPVGWDNNGIYWNFDWSWRSIIMKNCIMQASGNRYIIRPYLSMCNYPQPSWGVQFCCVREVLLLEYGTTKISEMLKEGLKCSKRIGRNLE